MRNFLSALLGGVVAVAIGAILIATDAIDTGDETRVVQGQAPLSGSESDGDDGEGGLTVGDIAAKAGPGVAFIQADVAEETSNPFGFPEQDRGQATGTAFVLNKDGYLATNAHVIDGARKVRIRFGETNILPAEIVGKDLSTDLAVVKVDPADAKLTPVPLGDSSKVRVGDPVVAIGNPFGYDHTVTSGIVSATGRQIQAPNDFSIGDTIQTDAAINPGNSGGPLLDMNGRVIGVNSQIATGGQSQGFIGIGFAVPVNLAKTILPQLIEDGEVEHAYIGITTAPVLPEVAKELDLPADTGALVQKVEPGSPAAKAGLRGGKEQTSVGLVTGGDLIVGVDGEKVDSPDDIATAIADDRPGDRVEIRFFRGDEARTVTVTLGERPERAPSSP
jgi:S1-C subfamily serine protease